MNISGQTALLTGATGGLGRAIATDLAEHGARLILSSRKGAELEELVASLPGSGHRHIQADLAESGGAGRLAEQAGAVDILVANAGLPATGLVEEMGMEEIARSLRVNLESPILMARSLIPGMRERRRGQLVFVSSLAGKTASPRTSIYNATKFGLRGFALAIRTDLTGSGVGSSIVAPGFIRDAGMYADTGAKIPAGVGTSTPAQVAAGVVTAIEGDRIEVAVAPLQQRAMAHVGLAIPSFAARAQSGRTGQKVSKEVADGHIRSGRAGE